MPPSAIVADVSGALSSVETKFAEIVLPGCCVVRVSREGTCVASAAAMLANMTVRMSMKQKSFLYKPRLMRDLTLQAAKP